MTPSAQFRAHQGFAVPAREGDLLDAAALAASEASRRLTEAEGLLAQGAQGEQAAAQAERKVRRAVQAAELAARLAGPVAESKGRLEAAAEAFLEDLERAFRAHPPPDPWPPARAPELPESGALRARLLLLAAALESAAGTGRPPPAP